MVNLMGKFDILAFEHKGIGVCYILISLLLNSYYTIRLSL
jgi:hypothetical protein